MFQGWIQRFKTHYAFLLLAVGLILTGVLVLKQNGPHWRQGVVTSDGRGYYYFLPAIFQGENDYRETRKQELAAVGKPSQDYILSTENGKFVNKCYPGVALMQAPSFALATACDYIQGKPFQGYSDTHLYFFFWTNVLFLFLSICLLRVNLTTYFGTSRFTWLVPLLIVFCTNMGYQAYFYPGLSHHYTFFLVNVWIWFFLRWKTTGKFSAVLWLAFFTGLLFLVRPTNLLFFLFIPFLAGSWSNLKTLFGDLFTLRNGKLMKAIIPFGLVVSILPLLTYWQTGAFFYWSYQGEGFIVDGSHFPDTWISYRAGILLHTPLVILGMIGALWMWKREKFAVSAALLGLIGVTFILSSWWCWDYQLFFGHRGFTEYQVITAFLLMYFFGAVKRNLWVLICLLPVISYSAIRTYQKITGIYSVQKFTATTYWKSLFDFDKSVTDKYQVFTNCQPYGQVLATHDLMRGKERYQRMGEGVDFWPQTGFEIPSDQRECRFYVEVHVNKRLLASEDWKDVLLIFAGLDQKGELAHYASYPLYNYYREGKDKWIGYDLAEEFHPVADGTQKIVVYIWNSKKKKFEIDDFRATVKVITSKKS